MVITLKVRIEMTPAQAQDYCDEYGVDRADLRADLARYVENGLQTATGLNVEEGRTESITVS